jgi:hypothetical protein
MVASLSVTTLHLQSNVYQRCTALSTYVQYRALYHPVTIDSDTTTYSTGQSIGY